MQSGQLNFTYKYLPILDRTPQDGESHWAAYAAECANRQGRFWDYHDKLFAVWQGENVGTYTKDKLKRYAAELQLDVARFNTCLDNDETKGVVDADVAEGARLGAKGTPAFFLNGQTFYPRALDFSSFAAALAEK